MIRKIYIDTSVFGGYFEREFDIHTKLFFERLIDSNITIIISETLLEELKNAPENVKELFSSLPQDKRLYVDTTDEVTNLAHKYIDAKIVGQTSIDDCRHIASATINNADILVSWNFKHLVNIERKRGYNAINTLEGYKTIEIISPREVLIYVTYTSPYRRHNGTISQNTRR